MCPLRFILVFFSAVLAAYFAWRTFRSSPDELTPERTQLNDKEGVNLKRKVQNGLWVLVDMANGMYLWKNLKEMKRRRTNNNENEEEEVEVKSL